jgi:RNA polymerase sigma factor (sigma-70 family)
MAPDGEITGLLPIVYKELRERPTGRSEELLELDEALAKLERLDERLGRVVELRFFGELSVEEVGDAMGVSPRTVKRDWRRARAFLYQASQGIEIPAEE